MKTTKIFNMRRFIDIYDVKKFVDVANNYPEPLSVICGKYIVNAKSLMGILSVDQSNTLKLEATIATSEQMLRLRELFANWIESEY